MNVVRKIKTKSILLVIFLGLVSRLTANQIEKPMVIVVPSYNNERWIEKNLHSLLTQDYKNFRVIYIDDCSTDNTFEKAREIVDQHNNPGIVTLVSNSENKGALHNIYIAVHACHDDEIVITVDGDDWLANDKVLQLINTAYSGKKGAWLTHGSYKTTLGNWGISRAIPDKVVRRNRFREEFQPSHLRTFYAWLFKKIRKEDLLYKGKFFPMTGDLAMMYPMLEMAGKRQKYIPEAVYIYNLDNPINDHKKNLAFQLELKSHIQNKKKYKSLGKSWKSLFFNLDE